MIQGSVEWKAMMQILPGLTLELSAQIFATVALKTDAVGTYVSRSTLTVERTQSPLRESIAGREDLEKIVGDDFDPATVGSFMKALEAGHLDSHWYDLRDGRYWTNPEVGVTLSLPSQTVVLRQDPIAPELKQPRPNPSEGDVCLTIPGVYLENLKRIPDEVFNEAVFRALGNQTPTILDFLWLHAGDGEVRGNFVTNAVILGVNPPQAKVKEGYPRGSLRFPIFPLQFEQGAWKTSERYVIGRPRVRDRTLTVLRQTPWGLRILPRQLTPPISRPPSPPKPLTAPVSPVVDDSGPIATNLLDPQGERLLLPRKQIIPITKPEVPLSDLAKIPKTYFDRAVRWCLGLRDPREGDEIVLTAGERFSKDSCIQDCLFVCPYIPKSRSESVFPKVRMEYRRGQWVILNSEAVGRGRKELIQAVLMIPPWGLNHDGSFLR